VTFPWHIGQCINGQDIALKANLNFHEGVSEQQKPGAVEEFKKNANLN
jgi:hypothetical protein